MTINTNKITFIATGGTIDSIFDAPSERKKIKEHSGIHLCMNAQCFTPDEVIKNREIGRFEFIGN